MQSNLGVEYNIIFKNLIPFLYVSGLIILIHLICPTEIQYKIIPIRSHTTDMELVLEQMQATQNKPSNLQMTYIFSYLFSVFVTDAAENVR